MTQKLISMTERELLRLKIINNLIDKKINGTDASKQMGLSVRHVKRLKTAVIKYGPEALTHKSRGRQGNRKLKANILDRAERYLKEEFYDFGPTFAAEKLDEIHGLSINKETIRGIMTNLGLWTPKPRKNKGKWYTWRARKDNFGEMQQFDGSYHIWFGEKESCLLLAVDDATGKITHAKFDINESTEAVFKFWLEYFEKNGLPLSIYLDKFSTYKINHKNAVDNKDLITQFERAMNQIGVKPITAHSAEAKGRVERIFETLQDRLVKELRLQGITTREKANEFLKEYLHKFNAKFAVRPKRRKNLHKKWDDITREKLPQIFSIQNKRKINNDYTIRFKNNFFQLEEKGQPTTVYKKDTVLVEERLDGSIKLSLKGYYLKYFALPERPKKEINIKLSALTRNRQNSYRPPIDHPWRKRIFAEAMEKRSHRSLSD